MATKMRLDAQAANELVPYIIFVESNVDTNQYSQDLYTKMLSNQFLIDAGIDSTGSFTSNGTTTQVTYCQLIGTYNLFNDAQGKLRVPLNSVKQAVAGRSKVYAAYFGLKDNFVALVKALQGEADITKWYCSDGVYTNDIAKSFTDAGVTNLPTVSLMSLGIATTGSAYDKFISDFKAEPTNKGAAPTDGDMLFNQIGYDMGAYMKQIVDTINADNAKYMSREQVLKEAQRTAFKLAGVTGSKGQSVSTTEVGWYDEYTLQTSGFVRSGKAKNSEDE
jgi:hypothetical protein